ncbi:MAG: PIG-L family deacetylase [Phycisphaerae bacterium]|nr:PIG-L family deacetylase [Phycisphaerae bacterium]
MMYRFACCILVLAASAVSPCLADPNTERVMEDRPYIFCVNNYGAISVFPETRDAKMRLLTAPDGMELLQPGGVLFWAPREDQIGEHTVRVFIIPSKGDPVEKTYRIRVKPLQRVLCVFAHPDDEFGIMAKMKRMADRGVEVWGAWTCGGGKHRDAESTEGMTKIGLKKEHLIFQKCGNFTTADGIREKIQDFVKLLRRESFDQIYTDAFEGGHTQHDMTHFIMVQATRLAGFRGQFYEFPLYNMNSGAPTMFTLKPATMPTIEMTLSRAELDFILSLVDCYPSQKKITQAFLVGLTRKQKTHPRYRPRPCWDYTRRTQPGVQLFEIKPDEGRPKFVERIEKPTKEYFGKYGGREGSVWEQDRTPEEQALVKKVFADPYLAKNAHPESTPSEENQTK